MCNSNEMRTCTGCGFQWPVGTSGNHSCESQLTQSIESKDKRIADLEALVMVYDATLFCVMPFCDLPEQLNSQVEAARSACLEVTGEPSMVPATTTRRTR